MATDINNLMNSWLTQLEKKSSAMGEVVKTIGHAAKSHPVRTALGIPAMLGAGEVLGRTAHNLANGHFEMGRPESVANNVVNPLANFASTVTGFGPLVSDTFKKTTLGLDSNPTVQQILDVGKNISNPEVVHSLENSAVDTARQAGGALGDNFTRTVGGNIGATIGHEAARGIWSDLAHHPIPTIAGAAAIGAGPAIAYDVITHRRRKEEAERNKAIMRYIVKQEAGMPKTAGVLSSMLQNLKEFKGRSVAQHIDMPSGIPGEALRRLGTEAGNGTIPLKAIAKQVKYPQTLMNNSITRHPFRSMFGLPAIGGTVMAAGDATKAKAVVGQGQESQDAKSRWRDPLHAAGTIVKNTLGPGATYLTAAETGFARNPNYAAAQGPTTSKITDIFNNLTGHANTSHTPTPSDVNYKAPHFSLSPKTLDKIRTADILGTPPEGMDTPATGIKKYAPYVGAAGLALLPFPTYMAYKQHCEQNLNKTEETNKKLQAKIEAKNQTIPAQ